ncbi:response regulator [Isoalcanivorax indicus]|uniref:response regulator n=1 Tax=Isoalcanivorax indicus TaxID=2202653 RepID=UPI001FE9262A|nr:response regulator transcription factor [Isoalcanivorax indicus]
MISLAMVEDDPQFRHAVRRAVEATDDIRLTAEAGNCAQANTLLDGPAHDVLLVDLGLPDGSGISVIQAARRRWPDCAIMVATLFDEAQPVLDSVRAGATGYLLKDALPPQVAAHIRMLHQGGSPISPMIARHLLVEIAPETPQPETALSAQEQNVLALISQGHAMADIAQRLGVSPWTVQTYIRRIYQKLGVNSRAGAVSEAWRLNLLGRPD